MPSLDNLMDFGARASGGKFADWTKDKDGKFIRFNDVAKGKIVFIKDFEYDAQCIKANGGRVKEDVEGFIFNALIIDPTDGSKYMLYRGSNTNKAIVNQLKDAAKEGQGVVWGFYVLVSPASGGDDYYVLQPPTPENAQAAMKALQETNFLG